MLSHLLWYKSIYPSVYMSYLCLHLDKMIQRSASSAPLCWLYNRVCVYVYMLKCIYLKCMYLNVLFALFVVQFFFLCAYFSIYL